MKRIIEDIKDAKQQIENLGLPLTIEPHDKFSISLLTRYGKEDISMHGMVNLLVLLLWCYHIRMIISSLEEKDLTLKKLVSTIKNILDY